MWVHVRSAVLRAVSDELIVSAEAGEGAGHRHHTSCDVRSSKAHALPPGSTLVTGTNTRLTSLLMLQAMLRRQLPHRADAVHLVHVERIRIMQDLADSQRGAYVNRTPNNNDRTQRPPHSQQWDRSRRLSEVWLFAHWRYMMPLRPSLRRAGRSRF